MLQPTEFRPLSVWRSPLFAAERILPTLRTTKMDGNARISRKTPMIRPAPPKIPPPPTPEVTAAAAAKDPMTTKKPITHAMTTRSAKTQAINNSVFSPPSCALSAELNVLSPRSILVMNQYYTHAGPRIRKWLNSRRNTILGEDGPPKWTAWT
jgi:hypothetical protein